MRKNSKKADQETPTEVLISEVASPLVDNAISNGGE